MALLSHKWSSRITKEVANSCRFLEVKAKSPENNSTSCTSIQRVFCFVKCFDIDVFCYILNQSCQLWIKEKKFTGLNVCLALNLRFWQVSQSLIISSARPLRGSGGLFWSSLVSLYIRSSKVRFFHSCCRVTFHYSRYLF